jgi:isocitrate lyase
LALCGSLSRYVTGSCSSCGDARTVLLSSTFFAYDVLQLGGLHSSGYISDLFAKAFATEGMKAYVELIQRRERELGTDILTHQKVRILIFISNEKRADDREQWSGADYVDNLMKTVTGGVSSTAAMGKGVTEVQFTKTKL